MRPLRHIYPLSARTEGAIGVLLIALGMALLVVFFTGCTFHGRKLLQIEEKISERVKQSIQIGDVALEAHPEEHRTRQTDIASQAIHDAAVMAGYPLEDQRPLVAGLMSANAKLRKQAEDAWGAKRKTDQKLRTVQMHQLRELQRIGAESEAESNKNIVSKAWHWGIGTFGLAGFIALLFFFPFLIPIFGRALAWLVGKIPKLAGLVGVVAVGAYDSVVRGIEEAKKQHPPTKVVVENELSRKMDKDDKALVIERKVAIANEDLAAAKKKAAVKAKIEETNQETEQINRTGDIAPLPPIGGKAATIALGKNVHIEGDVDLSKGKK